MPRRSSTTNLDAGSDPFLPGMQLAAHTHLESIARAGRRVAFVDIETTGLGARDVITVAACLLDGELKVFLRDENLDELLPLLDGAELLATFNGQSFDIPRIVDHFRIPKLLCPHVDLRVACREAGWMGGLKEIEKRLLIGRPRDLLGVDGREALLLWESWSTMRDEKARDRLLRYCAADVVALQHLSHRLLSKAGLQTESVLDWSILDRCAPPVASPVDPVIDPPDHNDDPSLENRLRKFRRERMAR